MANDEFYKDQYDRTLERKNEINSSLSTPIGILTALVAGILYASSNFEFLGHPLLSITFSFFCILSIFFLGRSIFHLVKALSDLHNGYDYAYLPEMTSLDQFFISSVAFYNGQGGLNPIQVQKAAQADLDENLKQLYIAGSDINQNNNKTKTYQRFKCHQFMIFSFISLSLLIIPFGIDFTLNKGKDKVHRVKLLNPIPLKINITHRNTIYNGKKSNYTETKAFSIANDKRRR
ncbi:hypothetical protein [Pedobacter sp. Leaf176]|uniref:hypothetical protein n=1 Tax=Pedobacter sp. Leaf176 TaxID=1736286 RepID=UPI0007023346|nr:hypothetical protein [Pedobacter sp. Leaf176]KQR70156.1 hypothetical protein ASF92_09150 [Pedobacter sp. Leaf176]